MFRTNYGSDGRLGQHIPKRRTKVQTSHERRRICRRLWLYPRHERGHPRCPGSGLERWRPDPARRHRRSRDRIRRKWRYSPGACLARPAHTRQIRYRDRCESKPRLQRGNRWAGQRIARLYRARKPAAIAASRCSGTDAARNHRSRWLAVCYWCEQDQKKI